MGASAHNYKPADKCLGYDNANALVEYAPEGLAAPVQGAIGSSVGPSANEVIVNSPALGTVTTKVLEFIGFDGQIIEIEMKLTSTANGGRVQHFTSGAIGHNGQTGNGRYRVEFTVLTCDKKGDPIPVSLGLRASSFQVSFEEWWADGTNATLAALNLTPVDKFYGAAGTVGTYPVSGIFETSLNDQRARMIGYENTTYVKAEWRSDAGQGSTIVPFLYAGPELIEYTACEGIACLKKTVVSNRERIEAIEETDTKVIYRYEPAIEGLNARFWDSTHGAHLDPLEWSGPADLRTGFPLPVAAAPDVTTVNTNANVNDSNSGAPSARYGIIDGWIQLPEGATHLRDTNANTGELGMVLMSSCCGGVLIEQEGGNHTSSTTGGDNTVMDYIPASSGWYYIFSPQSDNGAANGLQLQYSPDNEVTWLAVPVRQANRPVVECEVIPALDDVPEGWQIKPLTSCCQPKYLPPVDLPEPVLPATELPIADNEQDDAIRTGAVGTSELYAREDHNHPIVRQAMPADPELTFVGAADSVLNGVIVQDRWSDEESVTYAFRGDVNVSANTGWNWLAVPNLAGFQRPQITIEGTYRNSGNPSAFVPRAPYMGQEANHWSSLQRVYIGQYNQKDAAARYFVAITVKYTRS